MKITLKRESIKHRVFNKWIVIAVIIFAVAVGVGYFIAISVNSSQENQQIGMLNLECAAYGQQLTSELVANSTACQMNNVAGLSNATSVCGAAFYCYYSSSCAYSQPVETNTLSCLCDALRFNQVVASGLCFKQIIS
jgi:CBS domain containing-hemolysin-like protein